MVYDYGPSDYAVWAMVRDGPASMKWSQRRLAMATERMLGIVSNAGDKVLLGRGTSATLGRIQLSVMPFDSGPETSLGPAVDLIAADWSPGDESVVIAARRGTDSVAILRVDVATGRSTPIVAMHGNDFKTVKPLPGGGILLALSPGVPAHRRAGSPRQHLHFCQACRRAWMRPLMAGPLSAVGVDPGSTPFSSSGLSAGRQCSPTCESRW